MITAILCLVGVLIMIGGVMLYVRNSGATRRAQSWAEARGRIVAASISARDVSDGDGDSATIYDPEVSYIYVVDGTERTGKRAFLNRPNFQSKAKAQAWLDAHPAGSEVSVRYDPAKPDSSALEVDKTSLGMPGLVIGIGLFFVAVGLGVRFG